MLIVMWDTGACQTVLAREARDGLKVTSFMQRMLIVLCTVADEGQRPGGAPCNASVPSEAGSVCSHTQKRKDEGSNPVITSMILVVYATK